jgi:hypothetical protein
MMATAGFSRVLPGAIASSRRHCATSSSAVVDQMLSYVWKDLKVATELTYIIAGILGEHNSH